MLSRPRRSIGHQARPSHPPNVSTTIRREGMEIKGVPKIKIINENLKQKKIISLQFYQELEGFADIVIRT